MKPQVHLSILSLAALILACNLPATSGQASPVPTIAATQVPAPTQPPAATQPPLPTEIPTLAPTPTPSDPTLTPAKDPVNCRYGPGIEWLAVGALKVGETAPIIGKNASGDWWIIRLPSDPTATCWVAASVTVPSGNLAVVNVVAPPQAIVTSAVLKLNPTTVVVPGCVFPYSPIDLTGEITTNGPAIVEWHWEISQGNITTPATLEFQKYDTRTITDYVKYGEKGDYWVKLVVTKPNSVVAQASYTVTCSP